MSLIYLCTCECMLQVHESAICEYGCVVADDLVLYQKCLQVNLLLQNFNIMGGKHRIMNLDTNWM